MRGTGAARACVLGGFVDARCAAGRVGVVASAVAVVTVLAGVDVVTGLVDAAVGLLAAGPCLAAMAGRPRAVAGVSLYAVAAAAGLTWSSGQTWVSAHHVQDAAVLAGISALSVSIAHHRRVLERATARSEAGRRMLAAVVECSDDAVIAMSLDTTIVSWNPGAERMFGYSADEALGRGIALITSRAGILTLPELFARLRRGEGVDHYETQAVCRDGTVLEVSTSVSPLRDNAGVVCGAAAITRDITAHRQAEATRRVLAAVVEGSDDAIVAKKLDGTITAWNPGAERMYGYRADEAIGRNGAMLALPAGRSEVARTMTQVSRGERIEHYETQRLRKDGTVFDVSVSISPIHDDAGVVVGASVITRDITAHKRAEIARRDLEERSQQAQRLQSLGQLAGGIAHDFNNILAIILNYCEFIEQAADDVVRADAQRIHTAGERGTALARQLLVFARGEPTPTQVIDLNTVAGDAQSLIGCTIGAHITLITRTAPTPVMIDADPGQIHQILLNLVLNARDAMPDDGTLLVEVGVANLDEATVNLQPALPAGVYARLLVSDTGVGMSAEVARHVLDPFFTTKPKGQGTGLGLATVYGIVARAGGGLNIYSEVDLGTTVRIYLPIVDVPVADVEVRPSEPPPRGTGQVVVVVEDEPALLHVVERILTTNGYTVLSAGDGADALALLEAHDGDLLLTDMVMPGMTGRQLAEHVLRLYPELPVLYMSGYADGQLTDQRLLDEGSGLLQKPFTAADLLHAVHTRIAARADRHQAPP